MLTVTFKNVWNEMIPFLFFYSCGVTVKQVAFALNHASKHNVGLY